MLLPDFIDALQAALKDYADQLRRELQAQGHKNTGNLDTSITVGVRIEGTKVIGEISGNDYLEYINRRTKHQFISRAQIAGLTEYFQQRGLSGKELQGAVWGTARKQVEIGSPLPGSYRYSQNGKRTGAIEAVFSDFEQIVGNQLGETLRQSIAQEYIRAINSNRP